MFSPLLTVMDGEAYELLQVKWLGEIELDNVIFEHIKVVVDHFDKPLFDLSHFDFFFSKSVC
jgi:hypothetical protein